MMINKRLIGAVSESKKYIAGNVVLQWCSLVANIAMMTAVTRLLALLFLKTADKDSILATMIVAVGGVFFWFWLGVGGRRLGGGMGE